MKPRGSGWNVLALPLCCLWLSACRSTPAAGPAPTASPRPNAVLLSLSGYADLTTDTFDAPTPGWYLDYSYRCTGSQPRGPHTFAIEVGDALHPDAYPYPLAVASARAHAREKRGPFESGPRFLHIYTYGDACTWHVTVRAA